MFPHRSILARNSAHLGSGLASQNPLSLDTGVEGKFSISMENLEEKNFFLAIFPLFTNKLLNFFCCFFGFPNQHLCLLICGHYGL